MKAYTDIEQSKKLAEILPAESADMWWAERYAGQVDLNGQWNIGNIPMYYPCFVKPSKGNCTQDLIKDIPCWSLAALMDILESKLYFEEEDEEYCLNIEKDNIHWTISYRDRNNMSNTVEEEWSEELIDACFEMILKLKERDML